MFPKKEKLHTPGGWRWGAWMQVCMAWVFLFGLSPIFIAFAQNTETKEPPAAPPTTEETKQLAFAKDRLSSLFTSIQEKKKKLAALQAHPPANGDEAEKEKHQREVQALEEDIGILQQSFEEIATGGVDLDNFQKQKGVQFDWRADLEEILQPLFDGLKDLTEKPRVIEKLRSEKADLESRLEVINNALKNIETIKSLPLDPGVAKHVAEVATVWHRHREEAMRDLEIVDFQLKQSLTTGESFFRSMGQGASRFITGRGLNLLLAFLVFLLSWSLMGLGLRLILRKLKGEDARERNVYFRLFTYSYRVLTVLVSVLLVVMVLYALGDWILLGLLIIILIGVALGIKSFIPRFITETKLLLNIGSARENERVLYQGLPWRVSSINVYSWLTNPELRGGRLRLSLRELSQLHSRPLAEGEPWFPSREGDYLLLPDGSLVKVLLQSPEVVRVQHKGGAITHIPTCSFYESQTQNLSRGSFGVEVFFGIDYRHQSLDPVEVAGILHNGVLKGLRQSPFGENVQAVTVDFQQAGSSSLDYRVFATMGSAAATEYLAVRRSVWRLCVQECNAQGWVIPFTQLTLHQGEGFEALRSAPPPDGNGKEKE